MGDGPRRKWAGRATGSTEYPVDDYTRDIFQKALLAMNGARIPYVVAGAFALHWYSGFHRLPKDLDFFLMEQDVPRAMQALRQIGFVTRVKHPEWLAEGVRQDYKVDLIYGMGNWLDHVDREYVDLARPGLVLGVRTLICPPEEMIYSKAFVASRERNDSADVYHLLVATRGRLDWDRLLRRFGENWEVLLSHLVMFRYVYPSHRDLIPERVLGELISRLERSRHEPWRGEKLCRGYLLDGIGSYYLDVKEWGYVDARERAWERERQRRLKEREEAA